MLGRLDKEYNWIILIIIICLITGIILPSVALNYAWPHIRQNDKILPEINKVAAELMGAEKCLR